MIQIDFIRFYGNQCHSVNWYGVDINCNKELVNKLNLPLIGTGWKWHHFNVKKKTPVERNQQESAVDSCQKKKKKKRKRKSRMDLFDIVQFWVSKSFGCYKLLKNVLQIIRPSFDARKMIIMQLILFEKYIITLNDRQIHPFNCTKYV